MIETDGLMERLLEKFGLYVGHLKDSTSLAKNAACATLQGILKKLVDAKVLLRPAFLAEAKKFSLLT